MRILFCVSFILVMFVSSSVAQSGTPDEPEANPGRTDPRSLSKSGPPPSATERIRFGSNLLDVAFTQPRTSSVASFTNSKGKATLHGQIVGDWSMTLSLNARVQISPEELLPAVKKHLGAECGETVEFQITSI